MPLKINATLTDAAGAPTTGGGTWQVTVRNNGALVLDTAQVSYSGAALSASLAVAGPWTHLKIAVAPARYAPAGVELVPSSNGIYSDDPLTTVTALAQDTATLQIPLLRVREAVGVTPPSNPKAGDTLDGPWLSRLPGTSNSVYRELLVNPWFVKQPHVTTMFDSAPATGPFADPDKDGWDRFNTRNRSSDPANAGAAMLLEYGEIGSNASGGPRFLVGVWAPARTSSAVPAWRDMVAFFHPSTAKTWYPPVAYPFRPPYPYAVDDNPNVPPDDPDRTYQPYVNLALRYFVGDWSPYCLAGNESILVSPVLPNPVPKAPDNLEYGLPFRTPAGMARLLAEVNFFLHRIRYGFSSSNFDRWWGARALAAPVSSSAVAKPPVLRQAAIAAYSAATPQLDSLLSGGILSSQRYSTDLWGVPSAVLNQFMDAWLETWCLDLLADATTVLAADFETHLKAWVDANSRRKFFMGGSGTTGHSDPDAHYPKLSKASASRISAQSSSLATRRATLWRGPNDRWTAVFCSNPYLSASALDRSRWPFFPIAPSADDAHGFMFEITSGFVLGTTAVGVP